jgi:cyclic pyranopterin phosphate synthase
VDLIYKLKSTDGINTVTLTTNGVFAEDFAEELGYAGIDRVNVSLDTLNRETFYKITGVDCLDKVLRGIEALLKCDIPVRTNTVLRKGINDGDYGDIIAVAKAADIDVRFIEMMPIGEGCKYEAVPNTYIIERLGEHLKKIDKKGNGPAEYYAIDGFKGNIGFISPMSSSFCKNCSRIRLTSNGYLKGCLCYNDGISIRDIVRNGTNTQIMEAISSVILNKPECHCFSDVSKITEKKGMNKIGG